MQEVDLRPHQREAVAKLHNGSILCGGVGTGKSRVAMRYYIEKEAPKDVYVITTAKKRDSLDWEGEAVRHGIGTSSSGTFHGTLKVDSWNNLWRYVDVENALFVFDEQRVVGSGAWVKVFLKIVKKNHWLLLSATPGDTWLDYIPVFIANGFYKNRSEFLREHVVYSRFSKFPKIDRYLAVNKLVRLRNSILIEMPYERHTTRHIHNVEVSYDETLFKRVVKDRWHVYENRPLRDVAELFGVMRKVVNSDASRLDSVKTLLHTHPKVIVFYNFDYELEMLRTLGSNEPCNLPAETRKTLMSSSNSSRPSGQTNSGLVFPDGLESLTPQNKEFVDSRRGKSSLTNSLVKTQESGSTTASPAEQSPHSPTTPTSVQLAEWNGHKHEAIPKTDKWVYLVQYRAGAEGWNCIETDAMVFFSLTYSYRDFAQAQGRIDRMDTLFDDLHYYVFRSKSPIDNMIWKALGRKENFNERRHIDAISKTYGNLGKS